MKKDKTSPGLYIHIPFCSSKCSYCDFYSTVSTQSIIDQYIEHLQKEILLYKNLNDVSQNVSSIYIGGGNPAVLSINNLTSLLTSIQNFNFNPDIEFTIEANPENITSDFTCICKEYGVNRISLGVQSFNSKILKTLGRKCNPDNVYKAVDIIKTESNIALNLDIIFNVPMQTLKEFAKDIDTLITLKPEHLSFYSLILAEDTLLTNKIRKGILHEPDEDLFVEMYRYLHKAMKKNNYSFYEVSNFALDNYRCRHNENYWNRGEYFGFGASASGFINNVRYTNVFDVNKYVAMINNNELPITGKEELTPYDELTEYVMLSLRRVEGINVNILKDIVSRQDIPCDYGDMERKITYLTDKKLLKKKNFNYFCTIEGFMLLDKIIKELLF